MIYYLIKNTDYYQEFPVLSSINLSVNVENIDKVNKTFIKYD